MRLECLIGGVDRPSLRFQIELLFCVQDADDPAVAIVKKLQDKYPRVNSKLFMGVFCTGVILRVVVKVLARSMDGIGSKLQNVLNDA